METISIEHLHFACFSSSLSYFPHFQKEHRGSRWEGRRMHSYTPLAGLVPVFLSPASTTEAFVCAPTVKTCRNTLDYFCYTSVSWFVWMKYTTEKVKTYISFEKPQGSWNLNPNQLSKSHLNYFSAMIMEREVQETEHSESRENGLTP